MLFRIVYVTGMALLARVAARPPALAVHRLSGGDGEGRAVPQE
jgi:hypothetical protein